MLAVVMHTLNQKRREQVYRKRQAIQPKARQSTEVCRTCLSVNGLSPIFETGSDEQRTKDLKLITGIIIKPNDGYPQKICKNCISSLNEALQFRKRSNKAHEELTKQVTPDGKPQRKQINVNQRENNENSLQNKIKTEVIDPDDLMNDNQCAAQEILIEINSIKPEVIENRDDDDEDDISDQFNNDDDKLSVDIKEKKEKRQKIEIDVKDMKCKKCNKQFTILNSFRSHLRAHENFVVCDDCGRKFRNTWALNIHKRAKHNMEKIHKCKHCDYESSSKERLTVHLRTHTGEKPYICDTCGRSFKTRSVLRNHLPIHLPNAEKKFQCNLCPSMFRTRNLLHAHKHAVHTEKQFSYKCYICHNVFASRKGVCKHLRRIHAILKLDSKRIEKLKKDR